LHRPWWLVASFSWFVRELRLTSSRLCQPSRNAHPYFQNVRTVAMKLAMRGFKGASQDVFQGPWSFLGPILMRS
jgi:hypothetical protein